MPLVHPRKFIFYVDEMSLAAPTAKKLRSELDRLFRETVKEGDEVMVVRAQGEQKLKQPFSSDRAAVREALMKAINAEEWRATSPLFNEQRELELEMRGLASMTARRSGARRFAEIVRKRVQQRLGHLRAVVNAAAELPGRKILVLATESLPLEPGKEAFIQSLGEVHVAAADNAAFGDWLLAGVADDADWVNLQPLVDEIARSAATGGVTIYAVQPEYGIDLLAPGGDIGERARGGGGWFGAPPPRTSEPLIDKNSNYTLVEMRVSNTEATLRTLAETTGGTWHRGARSFDDLIASIATDVSSYYSLGYRAGGDLDTPHRVQVRVKGRPELRVRARKEVIRKSPEREMTDRVVASILAPVPAGEMAIRVDSKTVEAGKKSKTMWFAARVPLAALTFVPDGDKLKASFSVHYAVAGERSDFVSGVHGTQVVELTPEELERRKTEQWTYVIPLMLNRERYTVAIGVLDSLSRASGFGKVEVGVR